MFKKFLALFVLIAVINLCSAEETRAEKVFYCYLGTWSTYRQGNGKYNVEDIDPFLCTHVVYSFIGIQETGHVRILDPYLDLEENWGRGNIKKFNNLKLVNPKLKTLVACGGWNEGSRKFSIVAQDPAKRRVFAEDAVAFVKKHGFDGFDLDWEYPAQRDGDPINDKEAFVQMLAAMKPLFEQNNLILSAAVASAEFSSSLSYDIPRVSQYLDFINIMAYDLHGPWDKTTGLNAPLYYDPAVDHSELQKQLNVHASLQYWISQGAPKNKIVLGIPTYGRTFSLSNNNENHLGAPVRGAGQGGPYTNEPGMLGYNEFCEMNMNNPWTRVWNEQGASPYAYRNEQWVTYDDVESIAVKMDYINSQGLAGAMIWSLETDDFHGICGKGKNPLMKVIHDKLNLN